MILEDVVCSVYPSHDIAELIGTAYLDLDGFLLIHMPPVPRLEEWVSKFGKGHPVPILHLVLDATELCQLPDAVACR